MSCMVRILGWAVIVVMKTLSLAAAKTRFSALVEEAVATHEQIVVTRNGEPTVVVLAAEDFGTHRIQADTHNPLPQPVPCQNSRSGSELVFSVLVRLFSGTR